jgi:hypothetical protein
VPRARFHTCRRSVSSRNGLVVLVEHELTASHSAIDVIDRTDPILRGYKCMNLEHLPFDHSADGPIENIQSGFVSPFLAPFFVFCHRWHSPCLILKQSECSQTRWQRQEDP